MTPEGVFGPMPVGGAMIGGDAAPQTPPSFPILATPIVAMTPAPMIPDILQATMTTAPMTPDIPQATMTPAPTTPDIYQATMTSAPTTPVSYPFRWKSQGHRINGTIPFTRAKGEDTRLQMSKGIGKGRLPAYEQEYLLPKPPSVPPLPELGVHLPMPPPPPEEYAGVPTTPPMPRPAGVESPPPPPSPDAMSEASDSAVLVRGFFVA